MVWGSLLQVRGGAVPQAGGRRSDIREREALAAARRRIRPAGGRFGGAGRERAADGADRADAATIDAATAKQGRARGRHVSRPKAGDMLAETALVPYVR